jgi:hypothetical protein
MIGDAVVPEARPRGPSLARQALAQAEYRNLNAGSPMQVEDETVADLAPHH